MLFLKKHMNNNEIKYISVSALNRYISYKFEMDGNLKEVYLKGEISNFKYSGKHCYFSLKDQTSEISAMFFYPDNLSLKFVPKDGMSVTVVGTIQVYQKKGTYAIIVRKMQEAGLGFLYQQYLELKDQLQKEGLFDESRKLPIPNYPEKIAVITAPTGEAINDIISTFNRRLPLGQIRLYPALVQGSDAPRDLRRAVNEVYRDNWADVLIIGRGGGSFEDLSCFNDEGLARLLAESKIPVVSAVGHEGDYTICDFVAAYRAPTPTGAAMRLSKDKNEVIENVSNKVSRLVSGMKHVLIDKHNQLDRCIKSYPMAHFDEYLDRYSKNYQLADEKLKSLHPIKVIDNNLNLVNQLNNRLNNGINTQLEKKTLSYTSINDRIKPKLLLNIIEKHEHRLNLLIDKSILLNPFNVMLKGYSMVEVDGKIVKSIDEITENKNIDILMHDGRVTTNVLKVTKNKEVENGK